MIDFVMNVGFAVLQIIIQILAGTVIGTLAFRPLQRWVQGRTFGLTGQLALIAGASLFGMVIPLDTFGLIPIFIMLIKAGIKPNLAVPAMVSNYLFNMLVPFNTPNFVWSTGYPRVIIAFLIGAVGGLLLLPAAKRKIEIQVKQGLDFYGDASGIRSVPGSVGMAVSILGVYAVCGAIAETVFRQYVLYNAESQIFSNKSMGGLTSFFMRFNVVNPFFLLAVDFLYTLVNFIGISALLSVFKLKSFAKFVCYIAVCALLLSCSMFIR